MDKINELSLTSTILIASIILGGFYYASEVSKQQTIEKQQQTRQAQAENQATVRAQQLQDCIGKAKQDFANSYANLCTYYQTNQNQLNNPNWICPLVTIGNANPAYSEMVKEREDAISLCATLYK